MAISIRLLRANHGDCILVSHIGAQGSFNVLIDGGNPSTFRYGPRLRYDGHLRNVLDEIKTRQEHIDLAILTHIDDDHIGGLLRAFETPGYLQEMIKSVWFNSSNTITQYFTHPKISENEVFLSDVSPETGVKQGKALEALLDEIGCERATIIMSGQILKKGPFTFKILSPNEDNLRKLLCVWPYEGESPETAGVANDYSLSFDEILAADEFCEDPSFTNGSSIGFIAEAEGKTMLFLGDAHDKTVIDSLRKLGYSRDSKLYLDVVKISHHGSKHNTSPDFLAMIEAKKYLISTDGSRHGLPDKRTIARILASNPNGIVSFNYESAMTGLLLKQEVDIFSTRLQVLNDEIKL